MEKQILVVEDESIVAEDIRRSLQNLGYAVPSVAASGEKAIKMVEEIGPDLVLMDIMLQGKMDGIEAAEQIRSRFNIPVVYLTAYSDEKILERAKITEPFGYITKPFKKRELHINIEIALYNHKMEKKLKESEQWLSATLKSIVEAVMTTDKNGVIKTMNPFAEALTGWKREDAFGKPLTTVFNVISEDTGKQAENPVTKLMREESFYGLAENTIFITKEGAKIPVEIIGSLIKDDRANIIGIVLVFYDIIERKRAEEEINQRNHELSTLYTIDCAAAQSLNLEVMLNKVLKTTLKALEIEAGSIYLVDPNGEMTLYVYHGFSEEFVKNMQRIKPGEGMFGAVYTEKKPVVLDVSEYPAEQLASSIVQEGFQTLVFLPLISGGELIGAFNMATPRSVAFPPEDVRLLVAIGQQLGTTVRNVWLYEKVQRELEERKQAEETLKDSEERFRSVVESAFNAVIVADIDGTIISWNKSAEKIFLYAEEEISGKPLTILMPERYRNAHLAGLKHFISTGESTVIGKIVEMYGLRKDGTEFPIEISLATWKTEKGTFFSGIINDITERKRAEELRLEKERLEYASKEKSEFIANMSHELRTPLNAIIGFSEILKMKMAGELSEKQMHYVNNIYTSGNFLLSLINDILDLSKVEAGKIELNIEKIPISTTIYEATVLIKEKAAKHNLNIKKEIDPGLEFVDADKQRIKQVLFNLLSNAVKFSKEEGGTVTISAKKEENMAQFSVSDTGIGIKPENLGKLFQKFEQLEPGISAKYGGTGLGLAICKQLVEQHGGRMWAKSKYGEGSTFTFILPLKAKKQANTQ